MKMHPPKWALQFLRWFCREDYLEEIEGDLIELFEEQLKQAPHWADWHFCWQVLLHFRPDFIKSFRTQPLNTSAMFKAYFKITWRNLRRDLQFSILNIIGLTCGLSFALFIFLWVHDELNMDKFHEKDHQLYQVMQVYPTPDGIEVVDWTPALLAQTLKEEMPEIENAVSIKSKAFDNGIISYKEKNFKADGKLASQEFFEVFSYPLIAGNKDDILSDKYNVIISEALAEKLFGISLAAIGETIKWEKRGYYDYIDNFKVVGVFENIRSFSSDHFDLVFNSDYYLEKEKASSYNWQNNPMATYVIVQQGSNIKNLDNKISKLIQSKDEQIKNSFFLKQYSKNYLYGNYENGVEAGGRIGYVRLFSIIAIIILVIACINFMSLSTARASKRMKEIGVKKTLGARRNNLIIQFIFESQFLTFLSLVLATVIVVLLLPQFNHITDKQLRLRFDSEIILAFFAIPFVTGLFSSIYPALYLSSFNPGSILKGNLVTSLGEAWVRKGLVVFQFTVSVTLIVSVIVIYQQMNFIQSKNLGFNRDNIIRISRDGALKEKLKTFLTEVKKVPGVLYSSYSNVELIGNNNFSGITDWDGKTSEAAQVVNVLETNYDFIETFGIEMEQGRAFSREFADDSLKVILNEAAVKSMGLADPIGKTITFWGLKRQIVGITKDFQYQSLHHKVEPFIFKLLPENASYGDEIWIKIKAGTELATIKGIKKTYAKINPGYPFEFKFIEDDYQDLYTSESKVAAISKYFTGIVIILSCLGLFGLATFTAQKRRKEIGIRKVVGASVQSITLLLSKDFLQLVVIAIAIALPISWYSTNKWLEHFSYHIELQYWVFLLAGIIAIGIAFMAVGFQSVKAALANPMNTLGNE